MGQFILCPIIRGRCSFVCLREGMAGRETVSVGTDPQVGPLAFGHWLCTRNLRPAPTAREKKSGQVKPDCLGANL